MKRFAASRSKIRRCQSEAGSSLVELAMLAPALSLMLLGTIDFARVFYVGIAVADAARAGVQYGLQSNAKTGHFTGMEKAATDDAKDISGLTATATRFCQCSDGAPVDCRTGSCGGNSKPEIYVSVRATAVFKTLAPYPGIPSPINVTSQATMREQ